MVLPFENDNVKLIKTLAKRSFAASRFRNLIAVLAITLTAVLFTSVTTIGVGALESMNKTMQIQKMSQSDADIRYLTEDQYLKLQKSDMVKEAGLRMPVGFLTNTVRQNVELDLTDPVQSKLTFCEPTHGSAPEKANEIVASDNALRDLGAKAEVGAEVIIEFTAHGKDYQLPMVVSGWYENNNDMLSVMTVSEAFKEEYPEIFEYTYGEDGELAGTYWSDFTMKNKKQMKEQLNEFVASIGGQSEEMTADNYIPAVVNTVTNPTLDIKMQAMLAAFLILFVFCGYLLIYNVFDIAVMQEVRRYGLYRTIGMSKKQIKKLINRQAVWLSCVGIPLGLAIGFLIGRMTMPKVMGIIATEYRNLVITVSPNPLIFVAAAFFTAVTVWISTRKPVRAASSVSPMEAFRYVETKQKTKKRKTQKRTHGVKPGRMALANLGRNKRRTAFIIISLMLSVVMLNSVATIARSIDIERMVQEMLRTDYEIANVDTSSNMKGFIKREDAVSNDAIEEVKSQTGVKEGSVVYKNTLEDREVTFDIGVEMVSVYNNEAEGIQYEEGSDKESLNYVLGEDGYPLCSVYGMDQAGLARLDIQEGEKDAGRLYEMLMQGDSVIVGAAMLRDTRKPIEDLDQLSVGDTITARVEGKPVKEYKVVAKAYLTSDDEGFGYSTSGAVTVAGDAPFLYMPAENFKELYQTPSVMKYTFNVEKSHWEEMTKFLDSYMENTDPTIAYLSAETARAGAEASRTMIYLVGGIIGGIFGITGILNLVNMMSTSILARRREFATMQSIGMTRKQLQTLLMLEGTYYAVGAAGIGILFSALVDATAVKTILSSPSMWNYTYRMTLVPAVLVSLILIVIAVLIPRAAMKMFYKGSVVEQLRIAE